MNHIQTMMDAMSAEGRRKRSGAQMTLRKLIERLEQMPPDVMIDISEPHSYRGYYSDLAFAPGEKIKATEALAICRAAMGQIYEGYKGGDYMMDSNTPVWSASGGCCGQKIMTIRDDGSLELAEDE